MSAPADLTITPRDLAFGREAPHDRWWLAGDPVATAFYNALSATFPLGERFFIDSVKQFRHHAGPQLQEQIAAFIRQEALHTRQHVVFNDYMAGHGYDLAAMEARTKERLDVARERHPIAMLGSTVAMEHFTAVMAHAILSDPRHLTGASDEVRRMWTWHAMEEIEHKSVAYDTYLAATATLHPLRRWWIRVQLMLLTTWHLAVTTTRNMADMFRHDRLVSPRTSARCLAFLFVKPGILRQVLPAYLGFFLPGWHPWGRDDRPLLRRAQAELAAG